MRFFLIAPDHPVVRVPKGKELADVGYPGGAAEGAVEVPRMPRDHEVWDVGAGKWRRDDKAAADEELRRRGRALGRGGLLAKIEALEARVKALEEGKT